VKDTLIAPQAHDRTIRKLDTLIVSTGLRRHLEAFLLACRVEDLSRRTIFDYRQKIGQIIDYMVALGLTDPKEVTASHIRGFLLTKQETCQPVSVHGYYRSIKVFFNWLTREGVISFSPMAPIRPPKVPKKIIRPYYPDELRSLLLACEGRGILSLRDRAIMLVLIDNGIRLGELANINISDIDVDRETISVWGKGRKQRVVGISKRTQMAVYKYLHARVDNNPSLWVTTDSKTLTPKGIYLAIHRLGERAGLKDVRNSPHTFRHTAATLSIKNGGDLFQVQSMLGHTTLAMTRRYAASLQSEAAAEAHKKFSPVDNLKL